MLRPTSRLSSAASIAASHSRRQVIFSGIQPTGVPHLGNYLGALRQWVKLQDEAAPDATLLYSVVDLHAITVLQDPARLRQWRKEMFASLIAVGLDPKRSIIFCQSSVPAHSELMWILSCTASMGYLSRMTQWKSKLALPDDASPLDTSAKAQLRLGLFSYPVLQAADVLVHRATHVPVGEDQSQHLEFARNCANAFNHNSDKVLVPPETILSPAKRVMSLTHPHLKMSKSHENPKSRVLITDSRDEIAKKVKSALTDSIHGITYDRQKRPAVSNLIEILYHLDPTEARSCEELANDFKDLSMRAFKEKVANSVDLHLSSIRDKYESIIHDSSTQLLSDINEEGSRKARASANATMALVRNAVGL